MELNRKAVKDAVDYSMDSIKHICRTFGDRDTGSDGERNAQEYVASHASENGWADEIKKHKFSVAPHAFFGFCKVIPMLVAIAWIVMYWAPIASVILVPLALMVLLFQFVMYKRFLDPIPFYKKKESQNVYAVKKPTGEVKKRIIVMGHADAAYEWTLFHYFGSIVHIGGQVVAFIGALVTIAMSIVSISLGYTPWWAIVASVAFFPGFLCLLFFSNDFRVVPGANDNLTGCLAAFSVLKYMKETDWNLENTEVVAMMSGGEEAGLRGAKAFNIDNYEYLHDPNVETAVLCLDTFRDKDDLHVYDKDLSGTLKHDARMIKLIDQAVRELGLPELGHASVYIGASDGAAFTQAKVPCVTLAAMDPAPARYYHTRNDNEDNLCPEAFQEGLEVVLKTVELFDKQGLN